MDIVEPILSDVADYSSGRAVFPLYAEPVDEAVVRKGRFSVPVARSQSGREIAKPEGVVSDLPGGTPRICNARDRPPDA